MTRPAPSAPAVRRGRSAGRRRRRGGGSGRGGVEGVGLGEDRGVAVGGSQQGRDLLARFDDDVRRPGRLSWPCARTAAAPSRSAASPPPWAPDRRPVAGPRDSRATRPLPKTLTDASWPALSSSTTAATSSSSLRPAASRSVVRSSPGCARRWSRCSRTRPANSAAAARPRRPPRVDGDGSYILTIACDQRRSDGTSASDSPTQLGDDEHGQRLGVRPDDVERRRVDLVEQRRGQRLHPWAQPLDVPAVERARDGATQPGVLGRLVLHHLVAMQQVERLQVGRGLPVAPDPAQPAVAQHRPGGCVGEGQPHPGRLVPGHLVMPACLGEVGVGVRDERRVAEVNRGRRDRRHRVAPRPSGVRRRRSSAAARDRRSRTAAGGSVRTASAPPSAR